MRRKRIVRTSCAPPPTSLLHHEEKKTFLLLSLSLLLLVLAAVLVSASTATATRLLKKASAAEAAGEQGATRTVMMMKTTATSTADDSSFQRHHHYPIGSSYATLLEGPPIVVGGGGRGAYPVHSDNDYYHNLKPDLAGGGQRLVRRPLPVFRRRTSSASDGSGSGLLYDASTDAPERAFDYYDSLRTITSIFNINIPVGSSQIFAVVTNLGTSYRLAEIKAFLPFSNGTHVRDNGAMLNDAFTVMLAIYHFNNIVSLGDAAPILQTHPDLKNCNVRLTTELVDTRFSPIETTRTFSTILQRETSFTVPPPAAVVGALRSAVSSPLAILTGVSNITQVSYGSTAVDFDIKEQFPVFGRTVTSTVGEAAVAVRFFESIGSKYVAIIFITDSFGSALQKSFQDAASSAGIQTESIAISFDLKTGSEEARNAMKQLKETQYRHVYGIFFDEQIEALMTAAEEFNVVGPDYFYLFNKLLRSPSETFRPTSPKIPLFQGSAILQMQGGVLIEDKKNGDLQVVTEAPTANKAQDKNSAQGEDEESANGFERFLESWSHALQDPGFVQHVRDKLPASLDSMTGFDRENYDFIDVPAELLPFLYDAVFTLGLSMCSAGKETDFFNATDIFEEFRHLDVQGASGRVKIEPESGTRNYTTMSFVIWNSRVLDELDENGQVVVEFDPTFKFHDGEWISIPGSRPMVYADGSNMPPDALPPVEQNYNYIGKSGRIAGYLLMSITMFTAILSLVWLVVNREEHVVRAAQPLFLILVSVGSIVTASTIIPLSMEETTVRNGEDGLDKACMSAPWLYIIGMNIGFSALFAKTIGVHQAYMNPTLDFINVSMRDIFATAAVLLTPNVVVLLTWTLLSPLEWTRIKRSTTDIFGRHTESHGECASEDAHIYAIIIVVINFLYLILGNWGVYQSRNIETEYNESRYIAVSLFAVLQAWCMGIPILAVTYDNPQGRFYVMSGIIFVTAQSILSLVYIPKMLNLRQARRSANREEDPKRKAYAAYNKRSGMQANREVDDDDYEQDESELPSNGDADNMPAISSPSPRSSMNGPGLVAGTSSQSLGSSTRSLGAARSNSLTGLKVIHNPKSSRNLELSGGIEMSREQLDYLVASGTPVGAVGEKQEGGDNNTGTGEALSKLDKNTDETQAAENLNDHCNGEEAHQQLHNGDELHSAPLQNVDEEDPAAVCEEEEEVEEEDKASSQASPTVDKGKEAVEGPDEPDTIIVVSDDEGGDTEDTAATTST